MLRPLIARLGWPSLLALILTAAPASAQTDYFWNAPTGGTGDWDLTTTNWATASGGPVNYIWLNNGNERANFGDTAGTVTLAGGISAYGLNFTTTGYTIAGGTLTLAGTGGVIDTGAGDATINSAIAGTVGLTKNGAGILTLGGASNYTGTTTVSAGTLRAGDANVFAPTSAFNLAGGTSLSLNNFNQTIGSLTGTGGVAWAVES